MMRLCLALVFLQVASSYDVVSMKVFDSTDCTGPTIRHWHYAVGECDGDPFFPKFTCQFGSPDITLMYCGFSPPHNPGPHTEFVIEGQCTRGEDRVLRASQSVLYAKEASLDSYFVKAPAISGLGSAFYASGSCQQFSATMSIKYTVPLLPLGAIVYSRYETSGNCSGNATTTQSITNGAAVESAFGSAFGSGIIEALPATANNTCAAPDIPPGGATQTSFTCQQIKEQYGAQDCCTNPDSIFMLPAAGSRRAEGSKAGNTNVVQKLDSLRVLYKKGFLNSQEFQALKGRALLAEFGS